MANPSAQPTPAADFVQEGHPAPAFDLPSDNAGRITLEGLRGTVVVLYFYPKDDTPGCTLEAQHFRDLEAEFTAAGARVLGVSKDSVASHAKFRSKHCLPFPLLSDETGSVCEAYGVWVEKSMYGKKYMGIDRATFVIDREGVLRKAWRKVKVDGHAQAVLDAVRAV